MAVGLHRFMLGTSNLNVGAEACLGGGGGGAWTPSIYAWDFQSQCWSRSLSIGSVIMALEVHELGGPGTAWV